MRLLNGLYGRHIGQIAIKGTDMQRVAHVIQMLKTRFSEPIRVEDLAENGPYEPVVFPLSFQRLDGPRDPGSFRSAYASWKRDTCYWWKGTDAASAAYRVGYESASQFSREYFRTLGAPISDVTNLREKQGLSAGWR
jgi:hypothetical protein